MNRLEQLKKLAELMQSLADLDKSATDLREKLKSDPLFGSYNMTVMEIANTEDKLREEIRALEPDEEGKRSIKHAGYTVYMQKREKKTHLWDVAKLKGYSWAPEVFVITIDEKKLIALAKVLGIDINTLCLKTTIEDQSYPVIKKLEPTE